MTLFGIVGFVATFIAGAVVGLLIGYYAAVRHTWRFILTRPHVLAGAAMARAMREQEKRVN